MKYLRFSKDFALETDLICVSTDEYNENEPYFMDKYEIMNMLADKPRESVAQKQAENHYILYIIDNDSFGDEFHFICPLNANKQTQEDWSIIKWILVNLFHSNEKGERLFY